MKNVLVTVPSFSARCVSASKLLRENNFNLIIKNNVEHLLKSESTALRESICAVIAGKDCYQADTGNDSNLLIVFYVQIMPDDLVMQLHRF